MRIKSYFAPTVEEAMALARNELGPDAIFVNTRKAPPEARRAGEYEVVFASEDSAEPPNRMESPASRPGAIPSAGGERLSADVAELKRELEGMRKALTRTAFAPAHWAGANADLSDIYSLLVAGEVAPDLAREVAQAAMERAGGSPARSARGSKAEGDALLRAAAEELEARVLTQPALGKKDSAPRIAAFVGHIIILANPSYENEVKKTVASLGVEPKFICL
jgi:flagellar biosynthesis GTPase FlhF